MQILEDSEKVSRKSSVPSAVVFSAPLIGATVGDKFGEQVCEFTLSLFYIFEVEIFL